MNHNKAAMYLVEPTLFEAMMEDLEDVRIAPLIKSRLAERESAVEVDMLCRLFIDLAIVGGHLATFLAIAESSSFPVDVIPLDTE